MAKIIVIDDDGGIRELLRRVLNGAGHEVILAADGFEGLARQRRDPVDLIITDILMPRKDGIEIIIECRRDFPETPLIAIGGGSGARGMHYLAASEKLGAARAFTKPLKVNDVLDAVRELLARS